MAGQMSKPAPGAAAPVAPARAACAGTSFKFEVHFFAPHAT